MRYRKCSSRVFKRRAMGWLKAERMHADEKVSYDKGVNFTKWTAQEAKKDESCRESGQ